ncbi:MAG: L,D-transpeptidase [Candidatus Eisenbacteria bacterium]|uniref:L,D-transpeptidase n=1 Tax=Eiseniibacteriota bacterium TaxID=2212470 RepID=A0A948RVC4_UNCEI|nr:L,D-transpeptidase [Candidatus Eisenbacteria bacterium]MBU1949804.1 L,D-transpeptidase [Candidatus Eisenbacteria bacterium]MBU2691698.1 L,D-transpeptidase [Candidatus Eisenbacteria bacterium]
MSKISAKRVLERALDGVLNWSVLDRVLNRSVLHGSLFVLAAVVLVSAFLAVFATTTAPWRPLTPEEIFASPAGGSLAGEIKSLSRKRDSLAQRLEGKIPKDPYIVINTLENRFFLKNGNEVLLDAVCSTGSFQRLEGPGDQKWHFKTPRGRFQILAKQANPVWVKPDWAFIEENKPIPSRQSSERIEGGSLGRFAMAFGDGYFIHGTLYKRLLGLPVTHGCIRLGDADLEIVYKSSRVGTSVLIY